MINYKIKNRETDEYLFTVSGFKLSRKEIIQKLKIRGYVKGEYVVEWITETQYYSSNGKVNQRNKHITIIDPQLSPRENAKKWGRF